MNLKTYLLVMAFTCLGINNKAEAQDRIQIIRGSVLDADSRTTVPGTVIRVQSGGKDYNTVSDIDGKFRLADVPVGRFTLQASSVGYLPYTITQGELTTGKELVLEIGLQTSVKQINTVEIVATNKSEAINEMATVSARQFSVEETNRYAGSRSDPARMASNYAGVQGANDSRNDIVIRGNSPAGLLWRLEGIDIPNPNHFAIAGTTGGPVSILNNKMLQNSDFFTGAFSAEYGNANAGVFDLRMRNGNNEKHEYTAQLGFLGTELTAEGPFGKSKRSSYLVNYRYSTLKLFEGLKIKLGTSAVPKYQDGSFKLNFPLKKGNISVFAMGGISSIDILVSKVEDPENEFYGDKDRDQYFGSGMAMSGVSYSSKVGNAGYFRLTTAVSLSESHSDHFTVYRDSSFKVTQLEPRLSYRFLETKYTLHPNYTYKLSTKTVLKIGVMTDWYRFNMRDSNLNMQTKEFENRFDYKGNALLLQPYLQMRHRITDNILITYGLHAQYLAMNSSRSLEPRLGASWQVKTGHTFTAGIGQHSQMLPTYIYFFHKPNTIEQHNRGLNFSRSVHFVLGYEWALGKGSRIKTETYYQYLYKIPVDIYSSSFSLLNQGSGFNRFFPDALVNKGTGKNYGIELTYEKFFSKSYFILFTTTLYNSTYKGSDGIQRATDFNGKYIVNMLVGKEFKINKNNILGLGAKITRAGGNRYGTVDIAKTQATGELTYIDADRNSKQFRDYFRADAKISYKINAKKVSHEFALDLVNVFGTKNILSLSYAPQTKNQNANPIQETYQLGFLPLFYYKIDF